MVDVGDKPVSDRTAVASGSVRMSREAYQLVAGEGVQGLTGALLWNRLLWLGIAVGALAVATFSTYVGAPMAFGSAAALGKAARAAASNSASTRRSSVSACALSGVVHRTPRHHAASKEPSALRVPPATIVIPGCMSASTAVAERASAHCPALCQ